LAKPALFGRPGDGGQAAGEAAGLLSYGAAGLLSYGAAGLLSYGAAGLSLGGAVTGAGDGFGAPPAVPSRPPGVTTGVAAPGGFRSFVPAGTAAGMSVVAAPAASSPSPIASS